MRASFEWAPGEEKEKRHIRPGQSNPGRARKRFCVLVWLQSGRNGQKPLANNSESRLSRMIPALLAAAQKRCPFFKTASNKTPAKFRAPISSHLNRSTFGLCLDCLPSHTKFALLIRFINYTFQSGLLNQEHRRTWLEFSTPNFSAPSLGVGVHLGALERPLACALKLKSNVFTIL